MSHDTICLYYVSAIFCTRVVVRVEEGDRWKGNGRTREKTLFIRGGYFNGDKRYSLDFQDFQKARIAVETPIVNAMSN